MDASRSICMGLLLCPMNATSHRAYKALAPFGEMGLLLTSTSSSCCTLPIRIWPGSTLEGSWGKASRVLKPIRSASQHICNHDTLSFGWNIAAQDPRLQVSFQMKSQLWHRAIQSSKGSSNDLFQRDSYSLGHRSSVHSTAPLPCGADQYCCQKLNAEFELLQASQVAAAFHPSDFFT